MVATFCCLIASKRKTEIPSKQKLRLERIRKATLREDDHNVLLKALLLKGDFAKKSNLFQARYKIIPGGIPWCEKQQQQPISFETSSSYSELMCEDNFNSNIFAGGITKAKCIGLGFS